jgi:hypothetical protein
MKYLTKSITYTSFMRKDVLYIGQNKAREVKNMITAMKLARIKKELSQTDLWIKTGIPQWRLSLLERGIIPKPEEVKIIAEALGEKQEDIFPASSPDNKNARGAEFDPKRNY